MGFSPPSLSYSLVSSPFSWDLDNHVGDRFGVTSDITRRHDLRKTPDPLALTAFSFLFCDVLGALGAGEFHGCIHWDWVHKSAFLCVVVFFSAPCLLQREVFLVTTLVYGFKGKCLQIVVRICWFINLLIVVDSLPITIISLILRVRCPVPSTISFSLSGS